MSEWDPLWCHTDDVISWLPTGLKYPAFLHTIHKIHFFFILFPNMVLDDLKWWIVPQTLWVVTTHETCCSKHWNDKFHFDSHNMSLQLCLHYSSCLDLISKRWELSPPGIFWLVHGAWLHAYSPDILLVDCACGKWVLGGKGKQKVIYPLHNQWTVQ